MRANTSALLPRSTSQRTNNHGWAQPTKGCCGVEVVLGLAPGVPVFGILPALGLIAKIWSLAGLLRSFAVFGFTAWLFSGVPSGLGFARGRCWGW